MPPRGTHAFPHGMAYVYKLPSGRWRVQIDRRGVRDSQTFPTKRQADEWGIAREREITAGTGPVWPRKTLGDAIDRYIEEVVADRRADRLRLEAMAREFPELCRKVLSEVTTPDMAAWKQARLAMKVPRTERTVQPATVQREINTLSAMWHLARREWKWCGSSPLTDMSKPGDGPARDRQTRWQEVRAILRWLGYRTGRPPQTKLEEVAWCYLLALHTAMREGEVVQLNDEIVDLGKRVIRVRHKMQYLTRRPRDIPLTPRAARRMAVLAGRGQWFSVSAESVSTLWRKARDGAGVMGLTFHDARAAALTWLSNRYPVEILQRISGHKDVQVLLDHYYRETAEEIAKRL